MSYSNLGRTFWLFLVTIWLCGESNAQLMLLTDAGNGGRSLRVVANLTRGNYASDTTASGNEMRQARAPHYIAQAVSEIWLVYANWWLDIGAGGREVSNGNAVTLGAALEMNGITVVAPNASSYTLADDETFLAGPFYPSQFGLTPSSTAGLQVFSRTVETVTVGQKITRSGQYLSEAPASRLSSAAGASQLSSTGAFTGANNQVGPAPIMILGRTVAPAVSIITMGDSIEEGQNDTNQYPNASNGGGYLQRGAWNATKTAIAQLGRHGGTLSRLSNGTDGARRRALYRYASHAVIAFGANDLFGPASPVATFETNLAAEIALMRTAGIRYVAVSTVAPRTISTNKFTDATGQSQQTNWDPVNFSGVVNSYIAALTGGNDAAFDVNADWGDSGANTKWVTNGSAFYPITSPTDGSGGTTTAGTGTITTLTSSTTVTGVGTAFTTQAAIGNFVYQSTTYLGRVQSITNDLSITLEANALAAVTGATFIVATAQVGTHPSAALMTAAGTSMTTLINGMTKY